jgi:hypothetical protein
MNIFDSSFDALAGELEKRYRNSTDRAVSADPPPQLAAILRACFGASLRTEENRPTIFSVVCTDEAYAKRRALEGKGVFNAWDYAQLVKPVLMDPDQIRKIAAGLEPEYGAILVWSFEQPMIFGVARFPDHGFASHPHRRTGVQIARALRITARGPGSLVFDNLDTVLGELHDGQLTEASGIPIIEPLFGPVGALLHRFVAEARSRVDLLGVRPISKEDDPFGFNYWSEMYRFALGEILRAAQRHRRGATLVVGPEDDLTKIIGTAPFIFEDVSSRNGGVRSGFPTVSSRLAEYYRDYLRSWSSHRSPDKNPFLVTGCDEPWMVLRSGMSAANSTQESFNELRYACEFAGRLSAADGAMLLTDSLDVYTVGAKLKVQEVRLASVRLGSLGDCLRSLSDEEIASLPEYSLPRGSRFKSAVSCAMTLPDAIVFVISSDGPMSALARVGQHVVVFEPISFGFHANAARS